VLELTYWWSLCSLQYSACWCCCRLYWWGQSKVLTIASLVTS